MGVLHGVLGPLHGVVYSSEEVCTRDIGPDLTPLEPQSRLGTKLLEI